MRRLLKKIRCGWMDSDHENVVLARMPRYFSLILALFAVVVIIPMTSALSPDPYFPTGPEHGMHIQKFYTSTGLIYSYLVGKDVTNGGGAGNVFYTIYGDIFPFEAKIFWMESGETVTVWAELCDGLCTYIPAQNLYSNVRASQAGDTDVGSLIVTPFTPPNHGFSGTPVSGPAPLTVKFTDTSAGEWTVWSWDFGDGGTSTLQNPSHTYLRAGTYNVSLFLLIPQNKSTSYRQDNYITVTAGTATNLTTKVGVFRNSTHLFYLDYNGNGAWNGASVDRQYNFGITGDIPITGDWNNNGISEIGVFRPSTHLFYLDYNGNGAWNGAATDSSYNFGITGDIPISGDWNHDGISEIGVFRPSTHLFYLDYNGNGVWTGAAVDRSYNFGITGDIPITGDWNNNGMSEIGVFRPSTHLFYLDYNGNGVWNGAAVDRTYNFGITGDIPITGDWNGDRKTEIGVVLGSRNWYLDSSGNGVWGSGDTTYGFGVAGDIPITGNWK